MSNRIPSTQESFQKTLTDFEGAINQDSPLNDKAFLRVVAQAKAGSDTGIYKFGAQESKEAFAISASEEGLTRLGQEYKVPRKKAVPSQVTAALPALTGTTLPQTIDYSGISNGVRYRLDQDIVSVAGVAALPLTAQTAGEVGNLSPGDSLSISSQVPGAEATATVTSLDITGANQESIEAWRKRLLDKIRSRGGGSNLFDYRNWGQEVAGVERIYPYAGRPITDPTPSKPIERSVFVESSVDVDGIPTQTLLDQVRAQILIDPVTGRERPALGLTDETLFVEAITRTSLFVEVRNLQVDASIEVQVKEDITSAIEIYFKSVQPFIDGLDPTFERNDTVTDLSVGLVIQDVLAANSATASGIGFGLSVGNFISTLIMAQGEHVKLGGDITYA